MSTQKPQYKIIKDGDERTFEDKDEWQDMKDLLDQNDVEYTAEGLDEEETEDKDESEATEDTDESEVMTNGGSENGIDHPTQVVEPDETPEVNTPDSDPLSELGEELDTDPLDILPGHMKDDIKGTPAVNKRGYAMIAERYDIAVSAEIESYPWENDENRCVARAVAVTDDGREYSGIATAAVDDGDMPDQIIELAETRALKRATSWASGVGIVSYQELTNELEDKQ